MSQVGDRCCNIDSLSGNQSMTKAERGEAREEALGFCLLHNPENSCFAKASVWVMYLLACDQKSSNIYKKILRP